MLSLRRLWHGHQLRGRSRRLSQLRLLGASVARRLSRVFQVALDEGLAMSETSKQSRPRGEGWDLEERAEAMGHEDPSTTKRYYGRLTADDLMDKIAAVEW